MDNHLEELKRLHEYFKTDRHSKLGIATALRVDRRTVRRWFQGKSMPTKKHLKAIKILARNLKNSNPEQ